MSNIGIIINSLTTCGGEERVVSLMANEWVKNNKVTIYTFETRNPKPEEANDYYLSPDIKVERVYMPKDSRLNKYWKILYFYTGLINTDRCRSFLKKLYYPDSFLDEWTGRLCSSDLDIVVGISGNNTMLLGLIKDRIPQRVIGWEHSSYEGYFDRRTGAFKNRKETYASCARKLDKIVLLNSDIESKFRKLGLSNTCIIGNPRSFSSSETSSMDSHVMVTCGRVEYEKGYFDLTDAFAKFHKNAPDWKLLIVGGGHLQSKLQKYIENKGLADYIHITGYVKDVQKYLLQASIYVITSRWEGFPMTVTEALTMGLPVIGYDIPAMEPLVTDGVEGMIVPAFDNDRLADAMTRLAGDIALRNSYSAAALQKSKSLDPAKIAAKWDLMFKELTNDKA